MRWLAATGYTAEYLELPYPHNAGEANAVSGDGSTIVGWSVDASHCCHSSAAAVWRDGVYAWLPWSGDAEALAVDATGSTIVGRSFDGMFHHAEMHRAVQGSRTVAEALALEGVAVPTGVQLERADAVSPDGRVIAGFGHDASGNGVLWIASFLEVGRKACGPGGLNSGGLSGSLTARGSASVAANDLVLRAELLPPASWCALFVSDSAQAPFTRPGEPGTLCVGLPVAWFTRPGEVHPADPAGTWELAVDWPTFPSLPAFAGTGAIVFQAWYRDEFGTGRGVLTDALLVDVVP